MRDAPCKPEEIKKALVGAMIMDILPLASSEDITVSKRVSSEIINLDDENFFNGRTQVVCYGVHVGVGAGEGDYPHK